MGITQHTFGVHNVQAIVNLALSQGWLGKEHCGVVPIRGHSGVQGGAEVGAVPNTFPGGKTVNEENAAKLGELWGFEVPAWRGLRAVEMIDAAYDGALDVVLLQRRQLPRSAAGPRLRARGAGQASAARASRHLCDDADARGSRRTVVLLPAQTRYEQPGGGTETSTERRIIFSPEIPGPRVGEARCEWQIFTELAARVHPERREQILFKDAQAIRDEIRTGGAVLRGDRAAAQEGRLDAVRRAAAL